jgi:serine/threonine-protein kinase PknK
MADIDSHSTQRDLVPEIAAELRDAGFEGVAEIGRGGFDVMYRCAQPRLDRTVAVKVLTAASPFPLGRDVCLRHPT